jgi:pyridoxine/pyridoxamine 5'-phosphate oxidase
MTEADVWVNELHDRLNAEGQAPYLCVLATVDSDGKPTARCMYCREITEDGQVVFVSDRRTRKDDHLRNKPDAEVCFWIDDSRTQFRVGGHCVIVGAEMDDTMRQGWWARISDESRAIISSKGGWKLAADEPHRVTADTPMPSTFEILVVNPERVEMLAVKEQPHVSRTWTKSGEGWTEA